MWVDVSGRKKFAQELRKRFATFCGAGIGTVRAADICRKGARREFRNRYDGETAGRDDAICARGRTARAAEQQTFREAHALRLQTSRFQLSPGRADYAARSRSA